MDGGYYFGIQGQDDNLATTAVSVGTINKTISEGETLIFSGLIQGNACGGFFFKTSDFSGEPSQTNSEYTGEMHITKFDPQNQIVSGTFWFDVKHPVTGKRVEVRNGRFDAVFGM